MYSRCLVDLTDELVVFDLLDLLLEDLEDDVAILDEDLDLESVLTVIGLGSGVVGSGVIMTGFESGSGTVTSGFGFGSAAFVSGAGAGVSGATSGFGSDAAGLDSTGLGSVGFASSDLGSAGFASSFLGSVGLGPAGLASTGLDSSGFGLASGAGALTLASADSDVGFGAGFGGGDWALTGSTEIVSTEGLASSAAGVLATGSGLTGDSTDLSFGLDLSESDMAKHKS